MRVPGQLPRALPDYKAGRYRRPSRSDLRTVCTRAQTKEKKQLLQKNDDLLQVYNLFIANREK